MVLSNQSTNSLFHLLLSHETDWFQRQQTITPTEALCNLWQTHGLAEKLGQELGIGKILQR